MNPKLRDPATSLQWDAALEAPPDQKTTPAVLIVRERPPRSVAWRLLPVALLTLLTGGLLAKQSTLAAWPKLLDDFGSELVAQVRHAPPAPTPTPEVEPAPPSPTNDDAAPPVKKPAPEPAAPTDPTRAALAEIEREAEHQKAEQAERSRLQAEAERQAPPPREAPQRVRPRDNPEDIARFHEHIRRLREQQFAQMRPLLEDAQRRQDAWRRQMGLPPMPPMMRFDALRDFGIDPNDHAVPPPPVPGIIDANPSHARNKTLRESSVGQNPMRRGNIGLDRANAMPIPDAVERATLRPLLSPDGRLIGYQWRLNQGL